MYIISISTNTSMDSKTIATKTKKECQNMNAIRLVNLIAFILLVIGGLNWGLVGIFDWNLVSAIFGPGQDAGSVIVYVLILLATLWVIFSTLSNRGRLNISSDM